MNLRSFLRTLILAPVAGPAVIKIAESLATVKQSIAKPSIEKPVGFSGRHFFETGYVYAPYIPLIQTCHLVDPKFDERYTKTTINKKFYSKITICG